MDMPPRIHFLYSGYFLFIGNTPRMHAL
jgi:hypothetical protein